MTQPKAFSYVRFSTPDQQRGDSYRRQRASAEKYCDFHGLELAASREYTFFDKGKSAFKGSHLNDEGQLKRFLNLVEDGSIPKGSYLLVESLDRLSREKVKDALPRFLDLLNRGIKVVTLIDGRVSDENYNELDLIISIVSMSRAHEESNTKSIRVSKAWENKKELARSMKKPLGAACPYWLALTDEGYVPIPDRVMVIQEIFNLAVNGYGRVQIAKILNRDNVPAFGSAARNKDKLWSFSSVGKILTNRSLLGEYQPTKLLNRVRVNDGLPVQEFFPAVVTEELFYQAQSAIALRKVSNTTNPGKRFNLFNGIGKCDLCGASLNQVNKGQPPKGYTYLICANQRKGMCKSQMLRIEKAELAFREILAKVDSLSLVQSNQASLFRSLDVIKGEIQLRRSRLQEVSDLLDEMPSRALAESAHRLENEISELALQHSKVKDQVSAQSVVAKDEFFAQLDLVSYEGRSRANSLIKRLGLIIRYGTLPLAESKHFFHVFDVETDQLYVEVSTYDFQKWEFYTNISAVSEVGLRQNDVSLKDHFNVVANEKEEQKLRKYMLDQGYILPNK